MLQSSEKPAAAETKIAVGDRIKTVKPKAKPAVEKSEPAAKGAKGKSEAFKSNYDESAKIVVLVKENPRKEGTELHRQHVLLTKSKTVGAFYKAGGRTGCLTKSIAKKWVKIS